MLKEQILEKITSQLAEAIKASPFQDIETNLKAILQASFEKLDLVSREEFDIQQKVLLQTRMKLDELEKIIKTLEQNK
ncbi:MAG: accessory factor UbiK family protein [Neisseriales bacterium]|nr:MAG: accessory factor UbiK family protein [Neisseriales bacterium]